MTAGRRRAALVVEVGGRAGSSRGVDRYGLACEKIFEGTASPPNRGERLGFGAT